MTAIADACRVSYGINGFGGGGVAFNCRQQHITKKSKGPSNSIGSLHTKGFSRLGSTNIDVKRVFTRNSNFNTEESKTNFVPW